MVPALLTGRLSLQPSILNGEQIPKHTAFVHRLPEQLASISGSSPELLTRRVHRLPLALELQLLGATLLRLEQLPGTMDGPMTEITSPGETKGTRRLGMMKEITDQSYNDLVRLFLLLVLCGDPIITRQHNKSQITNHFNTQLKRTMIGVYILTRRSPRGPPPFLLSKALVVENDLAAGAWTAEVTGPLVDFFSRVSLHTRVTDGRVDVCEMGILNTFAREARTGERDRMA